MGSPAAETGRRSDEAQVPVTISRGFWTGKFEITQGEWRRVMGELPARKPSAEFGLGDDIPVYWVSFNDAEAFCRAATERARRAAALPAGWEFRLPTEAQWEYACRAGTVTATSFGDQFGQHQANFKGQPLNGGRNSPPVLRATPVGTYPANPWGICDMHGNVFEWCRDWYRTQLPGGTDPDVYETRGVPNRDGSYSRVRRGGAWNDDGWACRSALRLNVRTRTELRPHRFPGRRSRGVASIKNWNRRTGGHEGLRIFSSHDLPISSPLGSKTERARPLI